MAKNILISFLICNLFCTCQISPNIQSTSLDIISQIDSLILNQSQNNQFSGTIVIGTKDRILYQKAIGQANRSWQIPMTDDTRFDIASLNKSFIAALILIAEEEGKLTVNDKLMKFFPNTSFNKKITLHDMLTHTSGLPNYNNLPDTLKADNYRRFKRMHFSNEEYIDFLTNIPPISSPQKQFNYSNFAYHILSIILEQVYNQPFSVVLNEKISQPLALNYIFSEISNQAVHSKMAIGYNYDQGKKQYYSNNFIDLTLGRRIFSTSIDLYKWSKALTNREILSEVSYQKMTTNHLSEIDKNISYGYGWVVNDGSQYEMGNLGIDLSYLIHGGSTEGYKAMLTNINNGQFIIAHLSNIGQQTNEFKLTQKIVNLLLKQ